MTFTNEDFKCGLRSGIPIAMGYIPVAVTFGIIVVSGGLPPWVAVFISLTNLTSAGQFAGINLILAQAGYIEIALTSLIINLRYLLMSLSLTQKIEPQISRRRKAIFAFGITDETFSVASLQEGHLSFFYMLGLITLPIISWTLSTALGATIGSALPPTFSAAMGIALYAMFIAIIFPPAKKSRPILNVIIIAVLITTSLKYIRAFQWISEGFRIIIATVLASTIGAILWPIRSES